MYHSFTTFGNVTVYILDIHKKCYTVFEYLAVRCLEQRAKEAMERVKKQEATAIGINRVIASMDQSIQHCSNLFVGGGIFSSEDENSSPGHSSSQQNASSSDVTNGGQSFQLKPSKQRAKKKKLGNCVVL